MPEVVLTSHQFHMGIKHLEHLPQMRQKCTASYQKRLCYHNDAIWWSITQKTEGNILSGFIKYTKVNI